jgi:hypothetical protein
LGPASVAMFPLSTTEERESHLFDLGRCNLRQYFEDECGVVLGIDGEVEENRLQAGVATQINGREGSWGCKLVLTKDPRDIQRIAGTHKSCCRETSQQIPMLDLDHAESFP